MITLNTYIHEALIKKDTKLGKCKIEKTSDLLSAMHEVLKNYYSRQQGEKLAEDIKYWQKLGFKQQLTAWYEEDDKLIYFKKFIEDLAISLEGLEFDWGGEKETIKSGKEVLMWCGGISVIVKKFIDFFCI